MKLRTSIYLALLMLCGQMAAVAEDQGMLIVDTPIDVPYRLRGEPQDIGLPTGTGDFDYPRAAAGGLGVAFMSVYVPADKQEVGSARAFAEQTIALVEGIAAQHPDKFALVASVQDARRAVAGGRIALPMGMENGAGLEHDLGNVGYFHRRGVRYITLTHSRANLICDSSFDPQRPWGGLSPFGREVVREMQRLGMMVDVSHVSDRTFEQVMDIVQTPVIASHSSARHFTPGFERNMSDKMIRRLAQGGGVIQINFGSAFLTAEANAWFVKFMAARQAYLAEHQLDSESPQAKAFQERYMAEQALPRASLEDVLDHIDHVVGLVGPDHVGLGSDFDGVGDSLPVGLEDVSAYPNLVQGLRRRGYSEQDIRKIMGENLMRVWQAVEDHAARIRESAT